MILVGPVKCRHCHVSLHAFGRFSQRLSAPVISSSRPSANEDLPLPLRPTTTVRPGAGSSLSVAGRPIPRNPSTVTSFSHTGGEASPVGGGAAASAASSMTLLASASSSLVSSRSSSRVRRTGSIG